MSMNNKDLYNKILNATNNNEDIDFHILEDGYSYCSLSVGVGGSFNEGYYPNDTSAGTICGSGSGGLSIGGSLPPFISTRSIGDGCIELYIPGGTTIDYESVGSAQVSTTWNGTASIDTCSGTFSITLVDLNDEGPGIGVNAYDFICSGSYTTIATLNITDSDYTDSFRIVNLSIISDSAGGAFGISPSTVTPSRFGAANAYVTLDANNLSPGYYFATIVASDGVNSTTGTVGINVGGVSSAFPFSWNNSNAIIPQGLNISTSNPLIFAHYTFDQQDSSSCDCTWSDIVTPGGAGPGLVTNSTFNDRSNDIAAIETSVDDNIGSGSVSDYIWLNSVFGGGDFCCGLEVYPNPVQVSYTIGPSLDIFKTGIGPQIPFSGGIGNVENSYFIPLGPTKFIIAPQETGNYLSSNDDYFYIYTYGSTNVVGVKHPTETGVLEVVGSSSSAAPAANIVLVRYASSSSNVFYQYIPSTDTFTSKTAFASGNITRIIPLSYPGKYGRLKKKIENYKYLIIGTTHCSIYDVVNNTITPVSVSSTVDPIPPNVVVIPSLYTLSCYDPTNIIHNGGYYIFAVDHNYENMFASSNYPLILNINNATITDHSSDWVDSEPLLSISGTYLHSYLNYQTDIALVHDRIVFSFHGLNNGNDASMLLTYDNSRKEFTYSTGLFYGDYRRLTKLINDQVLWTCYSGDAQAYVYDPFIFQFFDSTVSGNIGVSRPCYNEYRNLLLDVDGTKAYIFNDYDRTHVELSFTGSLPMGTYHDIYVFDHLQSIDAQAHNFYLMPNNPGATSPTGNLVAISTTTVSATGISLSGNFTIDETVILFEPIQTTTGLIPIGSFTLSDDEFSGGIIVGFDPNLGDGNIFTATISGTSGTIYVKSGIALDYETKNLYTGYITGIDPYVGGTTFIDTFVMTVNNVDEKPTGIIITPSISGTLNASTSTISNVQLASFQILDIDDTDNNNTISIGGPDARFFTASLDVLQGILYLKAGTLLDISIKPSYHITLLAAQSGETFTASRDWALYLTDDPPVAVTVSPISTGIYEDYIVPNTGLKLADFILLDLDTNIGNYATLIGPDADYFTIDYDLDTNSGVLRLSNSAAFDYETKPTVTALIAAGNEVGTYSATGTFIINVLDIYEPTGIRAVPSIVYINEDVDTSAGPVYLSTLEWNVDTITDPMIVFDLRYPNGGFRSALDLFTIVDNGTLTPSVYLLQDAVLDYETQNRYDIYISGRPSTSTTTFYGGQLIVIVRDVNEAPIITFDPPSLSIPETIDTTAGRFIVSTINIQDEQQSTVSLNLIGSDASFFTIVPHSPITNNPSSSIPFADLYFNSGVSIDISTKNQYTARVVATDISGLSSTGTFILTITDVPQCDYIINATINKPLCYNSTNGSININLAYTGSQSDIVSCLDNSPLSIRWSNLPSGSITGFGGRVVNNLSAGSISGYLYGGTIPLTKVTYDIEPLSDLTILQTIKDHHGCNSTGYLTIVWSGGVQPYYVAYGITSYLVPSGEYTYTLPITTDSSGVAYVRDSVGCVANGPAIAYTFNTAQFNYTFQDKPLIYDHTLKSYQFNMTFGPGPFDINIYETISGEKGNLSYVFDKFDTSILTGVEIQGSLITDLSGITNRIRSDDPSTYYYDIVDKIYPGRYVIEFTNSDGCNFVTEPQNMFNIVPISVDITSSNDYPLDLGSYTIVQPILDTLFIPYRMLVNNADLLNYISTLTEKSVIKLQVGENIYERKILGGAINCDTYSIINIKLLGIKNTDWFYCLPFYQGFDLTDTEIDILNEKIYIILPNGTKIKIVTSLNNNINTIKMLKGSILTTDENTGQYVDGKKISLYFYDTNINDFVQQNSSVNIVSSSTLINKYIAGSIFRINFLDSCHISKNLRTDEIENITFGCDDQQDYILAYRNFLITLNDIGNASLMYSKVINNQIHSGNISQNINSEYSPLNITYRFYNTTNKTTSAILLNNNHIDNNSLSGLMAGTYIIRIRDEYNNRPKYINNIEYDILYSSFIDYIINELNTTAANIDFQYGDILVNIFDLNIVSNPPTSIPGTENPNVTPPEIPKDRVITTSTYNVSPNPLFTNRITIQTYPGKLKYRVTGPFGFNHIFNDKVILLQLPPGVYTIEGDAESLYSNYLYQQRKNINVNKDTDILINIEFISYKDRTLIENVDIVSVYDTGICKQ